MKRIVILTVTALSCLGCTGQYHHQVDQALLLQENQRLENALYVTHAQLSNVVQENESLKEALTASQQAASGSSDDDYSAPARPRKRSDDPPKNDADEAPPFAPPKISIPKGAPESNTIPDSLKVTPAPARGVKTATNIPVVPLTQNPVSPSPGYFPAQSENGLQLNPPNMPDNTIPLWTPDREP